MSIWFIVIAIAALVCLSAFFSASEMAYSSCNLMRLETLRDEGSRAAGVAAIAVAWGYRPAKALAEALSEAFGAPAPIAYDVPALRKLLID